MTGYQAPHVCAQCGGACCKRIPGAAWPSDFGSNGDRRENAKAAVATRKWAIDWWDARGRLYYIRPATKGSADYPFDASWGGECVFLAPDGCQLPLAKRPRECRMLEPRKESAEAGCKGHTRGKHGAALAWRDYDLGQIGREIEGCDT